MERTLGRIEGKLDALLDNYAAHEKRDDDRFDHVSGRLGKLERWQSKVIGIGVAAGTIGGLLVELLRR